MEDEEKGITGSFAGNSLPGSGLRKKGSGDREGGSDDRSRDKDGIRG